MNDRAVKKMTSLILKWDPTTLLLALEVELDEVAAEDEEEDQGQEEDDDLERDEEDVGDVGRREFRGLADEDSR